LAVPGDVGVLDAEHQFAAVVAGEDPVVQRGADQADVRGAGRRWREPGADAVASCRLAGWSDIWRAHDVLSLSTPAGRLTAESGTSTIELIQLLLKYSSTTLKLVC